MTAQALKPVAEMVRANGVTFPNESAAYRAARDALLAEEIELRRQIERVAEHRRALPPGGEVRGDYRFEGEHGETDFAGLFGDKDALVVYAWMYGPEWERPCPMCTTLLDSWDGQTPSLTRRVAFAAVGRAPLKKQLAFKRERGWRFLPLYADLTDAFSRDYRNVTPEGDDVPGFHVFTRKDGTIRHFWSGEMGGATSDPGQDPRGAPDIMSLWTILDATPDGRGSDFYPKLDDRNAA